MCCCRLGNDIYFQELDPLGKPCLHFNVGFGMMAPNWFQQGGDVQNVTYAAKKGDPKDNTYHMVAWNRYCGLCGQVG